MKRLMVAIVFVLAVSVQLFSQEYQYVPFPDSGAVWSEVYFVHDENSDEKTSYECFAVNGEDTIINGQSYTKVYYFKDSIFNKATATCVGGIREDSLKRIYYNGEQIHFLKPNLRRTAQEDEIILFDFGIELGDTIDFFFNTYSPGEDRFVISKIDTLEISGTLRKQYYFMHYEMHHWGFSWIEGIGSTRGLLFVSGEIPYSRNNRLICFFENEELVFHDPDYKDCFKGFVGVDEKEMKNSITLLPNPANNNEITFRFNDNRFETIMVYNKNGQLVGSYQTESSKSLTIRLPQAFSGVYFYKAITGDGKFATGKFILR